MTWREPTQRGIPGKIPGSAGRAVCLATTADGEVVVQEAGEAVERRLNDRAAVTEDEPGHGRA